MYSVIIPVYRNAEFIPMLIAEFSRISEEIRCKLGQQSEFVFVVDMSPDDSYELLEDALPRAPFSSQLILHTRNFGSLAAIRTGLRCANGDYFGNIAADLQEPPEILVSLLEALVAGNVDIVIGVREGREDSPSSRFTANLFWRTYRALIMKEIPKGGMDVFGCNRRVRDELLKLEEANSSLIGQVIWLGFRRAEVSYRRRARAFGKSSWTFRKKFTYLLDSVFSFTDLPVRILSLIGFAGTLVALVFGLVIIVLRFAGDIPIPGYAATVILISFFGALNMLGLGLVGSYAWRAYENTKRRPLSVIQTARVFAGEGALATIDDKATS